MKLVIERPDDKELHHQTRVRAAVEDRSMSDVIKDALMFYLESTDGNGKSK